MATENEKLRELLAEAREWVAVSELFILKASDCRWSEQKVLLAKIDAALAEPVADSTAVRLERVRDALLAAVPPDGTIGNADDVSRVKQLVTERDEARAVLSSICSEFEGAVAHADWRAAGSPGISVPFTGDFASATQLPSVVGRMRWWAREMRKVIGEDKP